MTDLFSDYTLRVMLRDSDDDFELCSSQEPKSKEFDVVPSDTSYKLKIMQAAEDLKPHKIGYKLKEGSQLPYLAKEVGGIYGSSIISSILTAEYHTVRFFISFVIFNDNSQSEQI